ncbi:uncharacterized protein LOC120920173 [Rana temporaria]|uniref:uncharacterized protein LOC120920173 n=1 Tax=Rana temporaria TaxID=8407 RepID=UPI001AADFB81|nr:uncharacterized protein LOC120920173 [Rana temporaria]
METVFSIKNLLYPNCFMATLNLRDAYLHVPIHPAFQKFLRIAVKMGTEIRHFQFQALPFGLSSSPRIFTKVLGEALAPLRLKAITIIPYLDDLLIVAESHQKLLADLQTVLDFLQSLGWLINREKSSLVPAQRVKYLGYDFCSVVQKVFLPEEKVSKMVQAVSTLQTNQLVSLREISRTVGLMTSCFPAVPWARFHQRPLQRFLLENWDGDARSLESKVWLPTKVKRSLWWWRKNLHLTKGLPWSISISKRITTDASAWGWGAHLKDQVAQGKWSLKEARASSNQRELLAVHRALQAFQSEIRGHNLQILSDNIATVAYLNKQGGTRSRILQGIAQEMLSWAEVNLGSISAVHLKGTQNSLADYLSRHRVERDNWSLHPEVFAEVTNKWGYPEADLFANQENSKTEEFFSLNPGDRSLGIDALANPWPFDLCYAFPPIRLIPDELRKFLLEETDLILIAPFWPKRPWFSLLQSLVSEPPLRLQNREDLLSQGPVSHPQVVSLSLTSWYLKRRY